MTPLNHTAMKAEVDKQDAAEIVFRELYYAAEQYTHCTSVKVRRLCKCVDRLNAALASAWPIINHDSARIEVNQAEQKEKR
jgi:hypothetical protein